LTMLVLVKLFMLSRRYAMRVSSVAGVSIDI
jgi:hypothetical protein